MRKNPSRLTLVVAFIPLIFVVTLGMLSLFIVHFGNLGCKVSSFLMKKLNPFYDHQR